MTITPSTTTVAAGGSVTFTVTGADDQTLLRLEIDGVNSGSYSQTTAPDGTIKVTVRVPEDCDSITLFVNGPKTLSSTVMVR